MITNIYSQFVLSGFHRRIVGLNWTTIEATPPVPISKRSANLTTVAVPVPQASEIEQSRPADNEDENAASTVRFDL